MKITNKTEAQKEYKISRSRVPKGEVFFHDGEYFIARDNTNKSIRLNDGSEWIIHEDGICELLKSCELFVEHAN